MGKHSASWFRLRRRPLAATEISSFPELLADTPQLDQVTRDSADTYPDSTGRETAVPTSRRGGHRLRRP
jgi:hypothetical protein